MIRFNGYLTERQVEWLKARSETTGLTVSELIRRFVDDAIKADRKEDKKRDR